MENKLFVDTNILIHLLNGTPGIRSIISGKEICISFVTEMELLSKRLLKKSEIVIIETLIESCTVYEMNDRIKTVAINFMRNQRLKMPDALIAATCNYYNLNMVTADKVFESIPFAKIINLK